MYLILKIGRVIVERVKIDHRHLNSCAERQEYLERMAKELKRKHHYKLLHTSYEIFVQGVESRANELVTQ